MLRIHGDSFGKVKSNFLLLTTEYHNKPQSNKYHKAAIGRNRVKNKQCTKKDSFAWKGKLHLNTLARINHIGMNYERKLVTYRPLP